jgi:hypothetical protein
MLIAASQARDEASGAQQPSNSKVRREDMAGPDAQPPPWYSQLPT